MVVVGIAVDSVDSDVPHDRGHVLITPTADAVTNVLTPRAHEHANTRTHEHTNTRTHEHTNTRIHEYTNTVEGSSVSDQHLLPCRRNCALEVRLAKIVTTLTTTKFGR